MRDLLIRSASGFVYVFLIVFSLLTSSTLFLGVLLLFTLLCLVEFQQLIRHKSPVPHILLVFLFLNIYARWNASYDLFFLTVVCLTNAALTVWMFSDSTKPFGFFQKSFLSVFYIVGAAYFTAVLGGSKIIIDIPDALIVFVLMWVNNTAAYFIGKQWGKRLLFEKISPKKTWEGFWGGVIFCLLTGFVLYSMNPERSLWLFLSLALLAAFFGAIGDLVQSKFKRIAGVKDSGRFMPGHGGFFDRMDSILFSAPILYAYLIFVNYVS